MEVATREIGQVKFDVCADVITQNEVAADDIIQVELA